MTVQLILKMLFPAPFLQLLECLYFETQSPNLQRLGQANSGCCSLRVLTSIIVWLADLLPLTYRGRADVYLSKTLSFLLSLSTLAYRQSED